MFSILLLLLFSLIVLFYLLVQQRKRNLRLKETLKDLQESLEIKEIKANLEGRDQERERIAKDWHDGIGNSLSTLRLLVDTIQAKNPERHQEALILLESIQKEFRQIIENELTNDFFEKKAIIARLERWKGILQLGNIDLVFKVYDLIEYNKAPLLLKNHFYRIVQELLSNMIKHSKATLVQLELREEKGRLNLFIRDNGRGITQKVAGRTLLKSIKDRLQLLSGKISIQTQESKETEIAISIPIESKY